MAPPPANVPRYDGLIYRSSLLNYILPAAPAPASEWSIQSKSCLDILGALARKHDPRIEDPLENLTLYSVRLSRDQGLPVPESDFQPVTTLSDFLTRLTCHFALIAHDGAIFSTTILRYQYERDAYNQPDSGVPIPTQLINSFQVVTHSIAEIRALVSNLKSDYNSKNNGSSTALTLNDLIGKEGRQAINAAVHYVEFYINRYKPALTALTKVFWDVMQETAGHENGASVVMGHMRWLMEQEDGDVRGRIKRTKLHP